MTTPSSPRGALASSGGRPRRRTGRLPRRSLVLGAGLFPLVVAGCGTGGSGPASVTGDQELLQEHGFADADAHEIIDRQPTIDPESLRPKGHWERPSKLLNIVNCTACKTTFPGDFDEFRYCPCCGAKMEGWL